MQILLYMVLGFILVGIACTYLCVKCKTDLRELLPLWSPPEKKMDAAFWGSYYGFAKGLGETKISDIEATAAVATSRSVQSKHPQ